MREREEGEKGIRNEGGDGEMVVGAVVLLGHNVFRTPVYLSSAHTIRKFK